MPSKVVLIPLSAFRVDYSLHSGRPFSPFEALVIEAIESGLTTIASLTDCFQLHPRLIVEALVTLTQAGWIGFSMQGLFVLPTARAEIQKQRGPRTRTIRNASDTIILERLTGAIASQREVSGVPERILKDKGVFEGATLLRPSIHRQSLDAGEVAPLLQRGRGGRGEWIGQIQRIELTRKDSFWLAARVRQDTGEIFNMPEQWRLRLAPILYEAAGVIPEVSDRTRGDWIIRPTDRDPGLAGNLAGRARRIGTILLWPADLSRAVMISDNKSHLDFIIEALASAKELVVIISAFLQEGALGMLIDPIKQALSRGVTVVCLWGYSASDSVSEAAALKLLREAETACRQSRGRLLYNKHSVNTHMKALIFDKDDTFFCCIGSFNWLSSRVKQDENDRGCGANISLCMEDPRAAAAVLRASIAPFSGGPKHERTAIPSVIARAAEKLEEKAEGNLKNLGNTDTLLGVVRDREHLDLLSALARTSERRLLIASHRVGTAVSRLASLASAGSPRISRVLCGSIPDSNLREESRSLATRFQFALEEDTNLHSKVLIADDFSYVGSFNFLAGDPYETSQASRELGIVVSSSAVSDELWGLFPTKSMSVGG